MTTWRIKRWLLEECSKEADTREDALNQLYNDGCNGDQTQIKVTCVKEIE